MKILIIGFYCYEDGYKALGERFLYKFNYKNIIKFHI